MVTSYDNYQIFYYVAENKNITAAANQLYLSQSTVSRAIQSLERDLGCTLLVRSKQGVTLTEAGNYLYNNVKRAFTFISHAENHLNNIKELKYGFLRIGATEVTLQYYLLPYLQMFEKEYPNIHINLSLSYPQPAIDQLNSGLLDIAILTTPYVENVTIRKTSLVEFQDILICSPEYAKRFPGPVDFYTLQNEPFILLETGTSARTHVEEFCAKQHVTIFPKYEIGSTPMILHMVERGLGIGFIPQVYAREKLKRGEIAEIKLKTPLPAREICSLASKSFPVHSVRDVFLSLLLA